MLEVAGLLHDIGHGPFSHIFEPLLMMRLGKTHEDLTKWLIERSEVADILKGEGYSPRTVANLSVGSLNKPGKHFLDHVLKSAIDIDKMDFVVRDSYHTGAEYGHVDFSRLIYTMGILNGNLAVNITALPTLEALLLARIESFRTIYFHRAVRAAQLMIEQALEKADEDLGLTAFKTPDDFLAMDDYITWTALKHHRDSGSIIRKLERRELLKCAYEKIFYTRGDFAMNIFVSEKTRAEIRKEIADRANVDESFIIIDVPSVPSIPSYYIVELPLRIPIFKETERGAIPQLVEDLSRVIRSLEIFLNIIRVYTTREFRERVRKSAGEILNSRL
jgi:hypothetical protein